jgi:hypothetical protein
MELPIEKPSEATTSAEPSETQESEERKSRFQVIKVEDTLADGQSMVATHGNCTRHGCRCRCGR